MATRNASVEALVRKEYEHGFFTDVDTDTVPPGLDEDVIRHISAKKNEPEFMLANGASTRSATGRRITEPTWANVQYPPIDYQDIILLRRAEVARPTRPKSLEEVDPEILKTYEKLGIPLARAGAALAGVAVDAVFDSVSVATTFKGQARRDGGDLLAPSPRRWRSIPDLVRSVTWARWCPYYRQLLRGPELGGIQRRLLSRTSRRGCAARWSCPPTSGSTPRIPASSNAP